MPNRYRARASDHDRRALPFGPPPLLNGEAATDYDELYARVASAVKPADILEEIWVRDIVDLTWELLRLRRLKVALFNCKAGKSDEDVSNWLSENIDTVDRIDLMITRAEFRRNAMVHEIDRHRGLSNTTLRRSAAMIETEHHLVEDKSPERRRVS